MVVRMNKKNDTAGILFENESHMECEFFVDTLSDKSNIEICDKY
jgi:hypothetical protein